MLGRDPGRVKVAAGLRPGVRFLTAERLKSPCEVAEVVHGEVLRLGGSCRHEDAAMSTPDRKAGARALLRFLARQGRVTSEDVGRIEGMLSDARLSVHEVLERENVLSQKDLALLLAETLRLKIVDLTTYPLDANITRLLKEAIATRYEVVPIAVHERSIEVVTANPLDLDGLKAVEFATGKRVQAVVATHVEVRDALAHTYRLQESLEHFLQLVPSSESLVVNELEDEGADLRTIAADAELPPVIKLADKMLI